MPRFPLFLLFPPFFPFPSSHGRFSPFSSFFRKYFRKDCFPELSLREALAWLLAVAESSPELMRSLGSPEGLDACRDFLAGEGYQNSARRRGFK